MVVKTILAIIAIIVACQVVYLNNLDTPFQFDDHWQIVDNFYIRNLGHVLSLWKTEWRRLLLWLSYSLNYNISAASVKGYSPDPWGFHLVNNSIHAVNGVLVFTLALLCLGRLRGRTGGKAGGVTDGENERDEKKFNLLAAWFAGMIFVLHPALSEGVTYVNGRSSSMCTALCLAALILYFLARRSGARRRRILAVYLAGGAFLCFIFALLIKELGVALPMLVILVELFFISRGKFRPALRAWKYWIAFAAVLPCIAGVLIRRLAGEGIIFADEGVVSFSYLLGQCEIIIRYIGMMFFPAVLSINHAYSQGQAFGPHFLPFIAAVIALVSVAIIAKRRSRAASNPTAGLMLSAAIFWFLFALAPTSSIFALKDWMVERRVYLASVLPVICAGAGLAWVITIAFRHSKKHRLLAVVSMILLAGALGARTIIRNRDYRTRLSLWQQARSLRPDDRRTRYSCALGWLQYASDYWMEGKYFRVHEALNNATVAADYTEELNLDDTRYLRIVSVRIDIATLRAQAQDSSTRDNRGDIRADRSIIEQYESVLALSRRAIMLAQNNEERLKYFSKAVRSALILGHFCLVAGNNYSDREIKDEFYDKCRDTLLDGIRMYEIGIKPWPAAEKPRPAEYLGRSAYFRSHLILAAYYENIGNGSRAREHIIKAGSGMKISSAESRHLREFLHRWLRNNLGG